MKNEIGRKITSLTIMAIMFAGLGIVQGVPSFMPEASADLTETVGMLSVSSTTIQGGAILEIVVNDPNISSTTTDISNGATVDILGTTHDMVQASNGKWYLYVVDNSVAVDMDNDSNGLEYGFRCTSGLGTGLSASIIPSGTNVWAEVIPGQEGTTDSGACLDADNMVGSLDGTTVTETSSSTTRAKLSDAVLQAAPSLSNHNDKSSTDSNYDLGQRLHNLNDSGYGTWPYILSIELSGDNIVEYGSDAISVEYGNTGSDADIGVVNSNPNEDTQIHLWISDAGLNIDPTSADAWEFDLNQESTIIFANNGTNNTMSLAEQAAMGCEDNCRLTVDDASTAPGQIKGYDDVLMTESGANTGVFESWDANGESEIYTVEDAAVDKRHVFKYAGNSADIVIVYNNAGISLENPNAGDWQPVTPATITVTDPDLNKNPGSAETLSIGNSSSVIPTIKVGSPLTLATGNNPSLTKATQQTCGGQTDCGQSTLSGVHVGFGAGSYAYKHGVFNTSDNSERLRIIHNTADAGIGASGATDNDGIAHTNTWINVTTGHTYSDIVNLPGTVVLNYDVSGPAGQLASTAVAVYVTTTLNNGSDTSKETFNTVGVVTSGNSATGVVDLEGTDAADDTTVFLRSTDISATQTWKNSTDGAIGSKFVSVNFKITHAAGDKLLSTEDYAIAADFCNFDQNNGSLVHNCIYRLEAEETGDNTGVFTGTVEYLMLNNSTERGAVSGEAAGNDHEVEGLITTNGDELVIALMDSGSGTDSVRVVYNDTDALQVADKIGAQLDSVTHTGTADLDQGTYGVDDMATITITDPDLNQDSSVRDAYQNSSTTFNITTTASGETVAKQTISGTLTAIETGPDTGVFVSTFAVPDAKGADMELVYYESRDAGGSAVEFYDTAGIASNSGSISLDKSVYPVPFAEGDLREGNNDETGQAGAGNVTAWITVTDIDNTADTLTTSSSGTAGTILVKLIESNPSTKRTCFTAGSAAAATNTNTSVVQELGPLTEIEMGTSVYEVAVVLDEVQHCGANMTTITSGDILQVEYVDTADDTGSTSTSYDSSTFDLRTGSLSVDKDVYVLGSDVVITLTDPDLNLDATSYESYDMSIIEWDSSADSSCLLDSETATCASGDFTSNPSKIEETGTDTGVFQTVLTLPTSTVGGGTIEYGESVTLTYVDVGLSGEDSTEDAVLDVEAYFSISNFGALIELDKAVYNWTDTVLFTITAPDHNLNTAGEETVGTSALPIQVSTRSGKLCTTGDKTYLAAETDEDTGVFEGEVLLSGFDHQMSSDSTNTTAASTSCGTTSTGGTIKTGGQTDGVSVSYEYNDGSVVVASASIVWNIGEASFDSSAASAGGSAVFSVTDADENLDNTIVDTFTVAVFSDSDNGGFTLTMNETDEDTGVFEGTVFFTSTDATSGTNLRVSEGDTVTAEYVDETLPEPYTTSDDLTIAGTLTIGTAFPPLERAPAANAKVVDAFGSSVAEVTVDQQVQIAADVSNGQDKDQAFAYLVQVQDGDGVTVSLAWITGSLTAGQSMSPALSWTPSAAGSYTATVFVWESVDNPTALSPTVSVDIDVV